MIRYSHRGITGSRALFSSLLVSGAALLGAACGGGSGTSKSDTALPSGFEVGAPDTRGAGGSGGSDVFIPSQGGTGGSTGVDAGTDAVIPSQGGSGGSTGVDTGSGGSAIDVGKDVVPPIDTTAPDAPADAPVDAPVDAPYGEVGLSEAGLPVDASPGQCPKAANAWNYPSVSEVRSTAWASDGNLIVGTTAFQGTSFAGLPLTLGGAADVLVSKLDPTTGQAVWLFLAGDISNQQVTGAALSSGSLGVVGYFKGTLDIDPVNQIIPPIINTGTSNVDFIMGLKDSDGTGVWSKKVDLKGGSLAAIAANPTKDYFIVCGSAMNTAANLNAANLGTVVGTPGDGKDVIVAAVSASDGSVKWAKLFGGDQDQVCVSAALDDSGKAVIAGTTTGGALDFGTGALASTGSTDGLLWVARLDGATGTVAAAKAFQSASPVTPYALATDSQGNIIVAGNFSDQVAFGSRTLVPVATQGRHDAFAVKLDTSTSLATVWARRWGGAGEATNRAAAVDSIGRVTLVGSFSATADVGPGSAVITSASGNLQSFVVTLDGSSGDTVCAVSYGDPGTNSAGGAISIAINRASSGANQDRAAIGGTFASPAIDFDGHVLSRPGLAGSNASYLLEM